MGTWLDPDGLYRKFGADKAVATKAGEYVTTGQLREIEAQLTLSTVGSADAIIADTTFVPKMRIVEVEVLTHTAAVGSGATLDLGLVQTNRSSEIDYDGLLTNFPQTLMTPAGLKVTVGEGHSNAGALIGTTTTLPGYITASWDTAAFTSGEVFFKIRYYAE